MCHTLPHTRNFSRGRSSRPGVHQRLPIEHRCYIVNVFVSTTVAFLQQNPNFLGPLYEPNPAWTPVRSPRPKSASEVRVRSPRPKSASEVRVRSPRPKSEDGRTRVRSHHAAASCRGANTAPRADAISALQRCRVGLLRWSALPNHPGFKHRLAAAVFASASQILAKAQAKASEISLQ